MPKGLLAASLRLDVCCLGKARLKRDKAPTALASPKSGVRSKRPCTISGRDRFERGKRLHGSAGASHSRDRENPFSGPFTSTEATSAQSTSVSSDRSAQSPPSLCRIALHVLALCVALCALAGREVMSPSAPMTPHRARTIGRCAQRLLGTSDAYVVVTPSPLTHAGTTRPGSGLEA